MRASQRIGNYIHCFHRRDRQDKWLGIGWDGRYFSIQLWNYEWWIRRERSWK